MAIFLRYKHTRKIVAGILVVVFMFPLIFFPQEAAALATEVEVAAMRVQIETAEKALASAKATELAALTTLAAARTAVASTQIVTGVPISGTQDKVTIQEKAYDIARAQTETSRLALEVARTRLAQAMAEKEGFWDAVAFGVVKIFLNRLTLNIVEWVRTGYEGRPTFLTETEAFFQDIGNQATGVFINEMGLNEVMCEPWKFGATFGLVFQKPYLLKAKCTLLDAEVNFQNMSKNFMAAGWKGFLDITVKQENNPYGAFLNAQSELAVRVGKAQEKQKDDLARGRGFFSITKTGECVAYDDDTNCVRYAPDRTVTPGSYIADSVSFLGMSSVRQAELADELNESLSVIAGEMIMQAINPRRGFANFDTVELNQAAAAFAAQTGGRLQDVASGKINDANAAKTTKESSLALIQIIYPIYQDLVGLSDVWRQQSCLGQELTAVIAGGDLTSIEEVQFDIRTRVATLESINRIELDIEGGITEITAAEMTLNGWYAQLTAATPPPPADLETISSGLNGISFPSAASATTEYNDLVSKRDSAQAALTECQS